jgi:hypothetical protein
MKMLAQILLLMLLAASSAASPYLTCSPQSGVTAYEARWRNADGSYQPWEQSSARPDTTAWHDLSGRLNGAGEIRACKAVTLNGEPQPGVVQCGPSAPFVLSGDAPSLMQGVKLLP